MGIPLEHSPISLVVFNKDDLQMYCLQLTMEDSYLTHLGWSHSSGTSWGLAHPKEKYHSSIPQGQVIRKWKSRCQISWASTQKNSRPNPNLTSIGQSSSLFPTNNLCNEGWHLTKANKQRESSFGKTAVLSKLCSTTSSQTANYNISC